MVTLARCLLPPLPTVVCAVSVSVPPHVGALPVQVNMIVASPRLSTTTVALQLNAAGHTLLSEAHRSLSGSLTILKSSPAPSEERTEAVYLVQQ